MEISIKAEKIMEIGSIPITNTLLTTSIVTVLIIILALAIRATKYNPKSRFYNLFEMIIEGFWNMVGDITGSKSMAAKIFPVIMSFFFLILFNNWFGILPGTGSIGFYEPKHHTGEIVESAEAATPIEENLNHKSEILNQETSEPESTNHEAVEEDSEPNNRKNPNNPKTPTEEMIFVPLFRSANSDLNMTLAIALISVIFIQVITVKTIGPKHYLKKFFNFSSPIMAFVGILELISEFVKIVSFSFRLFGNVFAGDVLLIVMHNLVPYIAPVPFLGMELFAGMIQAFIFMMLTLMFIKLSASHDAH